MNGDRKKLTAYDVADHYDAEYYGDLAARYRRRNRFARQRIRNVFALMPPITGARILDLGCGMGTFTIECARRGAFAVGVDPAPAALAAAQQVAVEEDVRAARFLRADAVHLPIADQSVDLVLAADVIEHLDDATLGAMLREVARVLVPRGHLVIYTPEFGHVFEQLRDRQWLLEPDPSHVGVRTARELAARVCAAGLEVENIRYLPSHLPVWNLVERGLQRWVPLLRRRIGLRARRR